MIRVRLVRGKGGVGGGVLEEFKHRVVFVWMLLRNEFIVTLEDMYIYLLEWK